MEHGELSDRRSIAPELVGVDDLRYVVLFQQASEERAGNLGIAVWLKENIQHSSAFADCPPSPLVNSSDVYVHFGEAPPGTPSLFPVAQALGGQIAEVDAPCGDGFASHADSSFWQQFFHLSVAEREAAVERL